MKNLNEDLHEIAKRANEALKNQPGFIDASAESDEVIRYRFDSVENAELFEGTQSLQALNNRFTYRVDGCDVVELRKKGMKDEG